jgi:hypothetical protein
VSDIGEKTSDTHALKVFVLENHANFASVVGQVCNLSIDGLQTRPAVWLQPEAALAPAVFVGDNKLSMLVKAFVVPPLGGPMRLTHATRIFRLKAVLRTIYRPSGHLFPGEAPDEAVIRYCSR